MLGSKLLKAVAVRAGDARSPRADPPAVLAAARDLRARSFGPATAKYRELGTLANLLAFNAIATLPTRNFQAATFADAPRARRRGPRRGARRRARQLRVVLDRLRAHLQGRRTASRRASSTRTCSRSARCAASSTPTPSSRRARRCDELGLDTISTGGTIAWAMECAERGLIDAPWLRFGDADALLRAIERDRRARGARRRCWPRARARAAAVVGQGSEAFAPHVKGLELPGYEPRTLQAMALGLAVNARGADHNRSGAYEADLSGEHDRLDGGAPHVAAAIETEDRAAVDGLADPLQVPARRVRGPVPGVGARC